MDTEVRFDGEVVIVTGGAGGIGRPQATELGRRGARVVINDLGGSPRGGGSDPSMAAAVVDEIVSAGGEAVASTEDVSSARVRGSLSSVRWTLGAASTGSCTTRPSWVTPTSRMSTTLITTT